MSKYVHGIEKEDLNLLKELKLIKVKLLTQGKILHHCPVGSCKAFYDQQKKLTQHLKRKSKQNSIHRREYLAYLKEKNYPLNMKSLKRKVGYLLEKCQFLEEEVKKLKEK